MKLKFNVKELKHFLILYLVIVSQGSVYFELYRGSGLGIIALACILFFIKHNKYINSEYMLTILILSISLFTVCIYTKFNLSLSSALHIIIMFILPYVAFHYDESNFCRRYIRLVSVFSTISVLYFIFQISDYNFITSILPKHKLDIFYYYGGIFATIANWHTTRNIGLSTEPGRTQIYLNSALFILLFKTRDDDIKLNDRIKYFFAIIAAIVTGQSTTGYLTTAAILIGFIVNRNKNKIDSKNRKMKKKLSAIIVAIFMALCIYTLIAGDKSFVYTNFIYKLFNSSGKVDLSRGTGWVRTYSMEKDLEVIKDYPLGLGFDQFYKVWAGYNTNEHVYNSVVGLTSFAAIIGVPCTIIILFTYLYFGFKYKNNMIEYIVAILIFLFTSLSQPYLCYSPIIVLFIMNNEKCLQKEPQYKQLQSRLQ